MFTMILVKLFSSIMLSEIVGNTLYDDQVKYTHLVYALAIWAVH